MVSVVFSPAMQRHVSCPRVETEAASVREALDTAFRMYPRARSYVLDDQAHIRKHIAVFVDGRKLKDRKNLSDGISPSSEILIVPALSGG